MPRYAIRLSVSIATFFLGLALSLTPSLFSSGAPRGGAFEREVLEANREYLEAHISRDVAALDTLLADEFVIVGRRGIATGKAQRLALLADSDFSFTDIDSRDTRVTASENVGEVSGYAVLTGHQQGREYTSPPYRYTRSFERRDGRWQLVRVKVFRGRGR
jgi:ketosteroid isomerase-like protein